MGFCKTTSLDSLVTMAPLQLNADSCRKRLRYTDNAMEDNNAEVVVARKRVRFALRVQPNSTAATFGEDSIDETIYESPVRHNELDKPTLWWSKMERNSITMRTRRLARGFKRQHTERVNHYLHVFHEASKAPCQSSSDYLESATLGVPTEVRGLECVFVPSIKSHRKQHCEEVLMTQQQLQKGRMSEAICQRVLSSRAIRSSRRSRVMARLMGEADAKEDFEMPTTRDSITNKA